MSIEFYFDTNKLVLRFFKNLVPSQFFNVAVFDFIISVTIFDATVLAIFLFRRPGFRSMMSPYSMLPASSNNIHPICLPLEENFKLFNIGMIS
jgi:hypothetical protein